MPFAIYFDVSKMIIVICRNDASMWMAHGLPFHFSPEADAVPLIVAARIKSSLKERHQRKYTVVHSTQLISQKSTQLSKKSVQSKQKGAWCNSRSYKHKPEGDKET
ncbi:hypothetical protein NC653_038544 [Populus alba x Populus x berolinensis]|uniref:Uncharacterized protein n=1 Tax=Populus alba x Populus x berolinensis TaxID=444605 RepID=A0AAD6LH69_9ROSI|nr:hypothetical protein NC653_038544 [Populus alba x Populus x berolinensis]